MGLAFFEECGAGGSLLVAADEDRLVVAGGLVGGVEVLDGY